MDNRKIIVGLYILGSMVVWFLSRAFVQYIYLNVYQIRRLPQIELVREFLPVGLAVIGFMVLLKHPKVNEWMEEVVAEVKKVVWPGKEQVYRSTTVVIVFILLASVILAVFDLGWGKMVSWLLQFEI